MSGPLETEEGRYMALWHYPLAPPWVPMPQVYLPHPFYAPVVSEYTGQVGIDTRFVNPELGYGFQNLPAARGYAADGDATSTGLAPSPNIVSDVEHWAKQNRTLTFIIAFVSVGAVIYTVVKRRK